MRENLALLRRERRTRLKYIVLLSYLLTVLFLILLMVLLMLVLVK